MVDVYFNLHRLGCSGTRPPVNNTLRGVQVENRFELDREFALRDEQSVRGCSGRNMRWLFRNVRRRSAGLHRSSSPFLCIGTQDRKGGCQPARGSICFIEILDERTLAIPRPPGQQPSRLRKSAHLVLAARPASASWAPPCCIPHYMQPQRMRQCRRSKSADRLSPARNGHICPSSSVWFSQRWE